MNARSSLRSVSGVGVNKKFQCKGHPRWINLGDQDIHHLISKIVNLTVWDRMTQIVIFYTYCFTEANRAKLC